MVGGESFAGNLGSTRVLQTLLFGNELILQQGVVSLRIDICILRLNGILLERRFRLSQLSAIALHGGFGLPESLLVRTRIDLKEEIALLDVFPFGKPNLRDLARYHGLDLHAR